MKANINTKTYAELTAERLKNARSYAKQMGVNAIRSSHNPPAPELNGRKLTARSGNGC